MRLAAKTDGRYHDGMVLGVHDHHAQPTMVSFSNTTQSLPPGTTYNLDVPCGRDDYRLATIHMIGPRRYPSSSNWSETACVLATRFAVNAIGRSARGVSYRQSYVSMYSKFAGDAYLTHKIFDNNVTEANQYIALQDAVLTGSVLRLTFRNYFGGSATLWVKGEALLR